MFGTWFQMIINDLYSSRTLLFLKLFWMHNNKSAFICVYPRFFSPQGMWSSQRWDHNCNFYYKGVSVSSLFYSWSCFKKTPTDSYFIIHSILVPSFLLLSRRPYSVAILSVFPFKIRDISSSIPEMDFSPAKLFLRSIYFFNFRWYILNIYIYSCRALLSAPRNGWKSHLFFRLKREAQATDNHWWSLRLHLHPISRAKSSCFSLICSSWWDMVSFSWSAFQYSQNHNLLQLLITLCRKFFPSSPRDQVYKVKSHARNY